MKEKIAVTLVVLMLVLAVSVSAAGGKDDYQATVRDGRGRYVVSALLRDGTSYVPFRAFCVAFDGSGSVGWDGATATASYTARGLTLTASVGKIYITANGRYFGFDGEILLEDGRVYVPVRGMARAFGASVTWDGVTRTVTLTGDTSYPADAGAVYDADELRWLSAIISAESRGEPMRGKVAVGNVVLNRVASDEFPDSVREVVFEREGNVVQFTPVSNGTITDPPTAESVIAAKICLDGYSVCPKALFFFNPAISSGVWITGNRKYEETIGAHAFYS